MMRPGPLQVRDHSENAENSHVTSYRPPITATEEPEGMPEVRVIVVKDKPPFQLKPRCRIKLA